MSLHNFLTIFQYFLKSIISNPGYKESEDLQNIF